MRFEKWQALGNDYVIVEGAALPAPLTGDAVRALCDRHTGIGADGVLLLEPADEPGIVARLRIFNPDGSEAELSGNGAREAILYLRHRGWTDSDQFSILMVAGEIRPTILSETTCRVDMGRAGDHGMGEVESGGGTGGGPPNPLRHPPRAGAGGGGGGGWGGRPPAGGAGGGGAPPRPPPPTPGRGGRAP